MRKFPELFLGLLAIGLAVVLTTLVVSGTIRDVRGTKDTVTVTASARKPIDANLVHWSLTVGAEEPTAAAAAKLLRGDVAAVRAFLIGGRVPPSAISSSVVSSEKLVEQLPKRQRRITFRVTQRLDVKSTLIGVLEKAGPRVGALLERGIDVYVEPLEYLSTELGQAKLDALGAATAEARKRADVLARGLGGKLGRMKSSSLGVYQVTPRDSTEVSDYGINDTSSREKDVTAVVTATFFVKR